VGSLAAVTVTAGPAPRALGRGVVVAEGDPVPETWAGTPIVTVDAEALDEPDGTVEVLHEAWATRTPVVIVLAVDPASFRAPRSYPPERTSPPWTLDPGFELGDDRLHFLVWANTYDARGGGDPVWWWGRKAERLGASPGSPGDVVLPDGTRAWIDGGPRGGPSREDVGGVAIVPSESVEAGHLRPVPAPSSAGPALDLAPDQRAAVFHGAGPARVIAPAGSGKTRVLTERLRHLVLDRGYEPASVVAVAYNRKARDEMVARTPGVGGRILTLNALGYDVLAAGLGRRPAVIENRDVRRLLEPLVPTGARRLNTDPLAPYVEALTTVRLGLRDPVEVEDERGDVPGLAEAAPAYRDALAERGVVDFDEQVVRSIELLLADGPFRRAQQARHRHLLVDEFQDLTPAHVLLIRLLAAPTFDVFGVGDDDQVIYGHAGASPRFLTEFTSYFPAAHEHALEVNYRCPPEVVDAARHLLTRNRVRVPKTIRAARAAGDPGPAGDGSLFGGDVRPVEPLAVVLHPPDGGAAAVVEAVRAWLAGATVRPSDVAVLVRVGSSLLGPHVALVEAGVPVSSILRADVLDRTGVRAALAYLRIAADPENIVPADLTEVHRRPSRGLPRWIDRWLGRCRTIGDVERAGERIDDVKVSGKLADLAADLRAAGQLAARGGTTRAVLEYVRDGLGLGHAVDLLDATGGGEGQTHRDDLDALLQVADLHPDPGGFAGWLRSALDRPDSPDGVTLSTVHRVKGREWPRVAVFAASDGVMPHRLSQGRAGAEEERRVFHVAITRGIGAVTVLADRERPSPFLAELAADATAEELAAADARAAPAAPALLAASGRGPGPRMKGPVPKASGPEAARVEAALRAWRRERSRADGVPAFVVLSDRHLMGIAERRPATTRDLAACPGIGPAKLAAYGDELVELVASAGSGGTEPRTERDAGH
jgi:DNA helicase-2/ATP-dependent DNA helicase PcrA